MKVRTQHRHLTRHRANVKLKLRFQYVQILSPLIRMIMADIKNIKK
jgi:hypothetical protein